MPTPPHNFSRKNPKLAKLPTQTPLPADPSLANLETQGEKLKIYSLDHLLKNKRPRSARAPANLADILIPWFEKTIERPAAKLAGVTELWIAHAPKNLAPHTRLVSLIKGTLLVSADNAVVRAELDGALRRGLTKLLQIESRGLIYRVKTILEASKIQEIS